MFVRIFLSKSIVSFIAVYRSLNRSALYTLPLQHLLETVLTAKNVLMAGHSVPGVIGLQNHRHLSCSSSSPDEDRDQILCFQRIALNFFSKNLKPSSRTSRKIVESSLTYSWIPENSHQQPHRLPLLHLQSLRCSWFPQPQSNCSGRPSCKHHGLHPPLSDKVFFFSTKPAMQDSPPFTRYS